MAMKTSQMTEQSSMSNNTKTEFLSSSLSSFQAFEKDYPRFDSLDPSLDGGYKIVFIQELPVKIKLLEGIESFNETTNIEPVLIKLMAKTVGKDKHVEGVKMELTTEADLFFNFVFDANESSFLQMKKKQKWNIDFDQLAASIIKQLLCCQHDPQNYQLVFEINKELNGELIISQTTEFRNIEIMRLDFETATQESIRQSVVFRYNILKAKVMISTQRVSDTLQILQEKNESLCEFVKKNTSLVRPKQYSPNY